MKIFLQNLNGKPRVLDGLVMDWWRHWWQCATGNIILTETLKTVGDTSKQLVDCPYSSELVSALTVNAGFDITNTPNNMG